MVYSFDFTWHGPRKGSRRMALPSCEKLGKGLPSSCLASGWASRKGIHAKHLLKPLSRSNYVRLLHRPMCHSHRALPVKMSMATMCAFAWPCFPVFEVETSTHLGDLGDLGDKLMTLSTLYAINKQNLKCVCVFVAVYYASNII